MTRNHKIDYIELPARNFDAVQNFYEQAFGWTFTDYGPEYRAFHDGDREGGFYRADLQSTVSAGSALVILFADDLEATRKDVVDSGGKISQEIISFPGGRRFQFTDPNGNELAVWSDK